MSPLHALIVAAGIVFQLFNATCLGSWLAAYGYTTREEWGSTLRFVTGIAIFYLGLAANFFQEVLFYTTAAGSSVHPIVRKALRLPKHTDHPRLQEAILALFEHHDALRTVLRWDAATNGMAQCVLKVDTDSSALTSIQRKFSTFKAFETFLNDDGGDEIDLQTTLPLRTAIVSIDDEGDQVLLFEILCTIYDDASWTIIKSDLAKFYEMQGEITSSVSNSEVGGSFASFASFQRRLVESERGVKAQAYFSTLLDQCRPIELPSDASDRPPTDQVHEKLMMRMCHLMRR